MLNKTKISKDFAIVFGTIFFILILFCTYNGFFVYSILFLLLFLSVVYLYIKNVNYLFSVAMLWSKFGYFIAKFISPIILFLFYSLIFVPFSLFVKIVKRDVLETKFNNAQTYWKKRLISINSMKQQF